VKAAGSVVLGFAILVGMTAIGIGFLTGAAAFSMWVLKWTFAPFTITFLVSLLLLGPLSLIPPARGFSAVGFVIASSAFGVILWIWGLAYTYSVWGFIGVIIGLVLFGGGVVPIAMLAALVHGDWGNLGLFVVTAFIVVGCRLLANWLAEKADERAARLKRSEITVQAYEVPE
jgi:hypothetical protein